MPYQIWNRRYTGSKYKIAEWIHNLILQNCSGTSFCDIFAGTAIMSKYALDNYEEIFINDFLYSNEIIYKSFFEQTDYDEEKLNRLCEQFNMIDISNIPENYVSINFGNKYFSYADALIIGYIREQIEIIKVSEKERNILLASLLYSADKSANTVGHYDAYIKGKTIHDTFKFELITPYQYKNKKIHITRRDANEIAKEIQTDIVYIDPPYNSRQYSRFYHVLENIACWNKPDLFGEACKPLPENMSEYCRSTATTVFEDLINSLKCKYIVVSYNNTYNSKSSSSKNKITLENIERILSNRGAVSIYEKPFQYFNAGKTDLKDHKELIFIVKVGKEND